MKHYTPNQDEFRALSSEANTIPVYRQLLSDTLSPVTAFLALAQASENAFLLESVIGGERIGRYSFLGVDPFMTLEARGSEVVLQKGGHTRCQEAKDPLGVLEKVIGRYQTAHVRGLPRFTGGAVGYAGYDVIRYYEGEKLPHPPDDDRNLPDYLFGLYDTMVLFDHVSKTIKVVSNAHLRPGEDPKEAYRKACHRIEETIERLKRPSKVPTGEIDPGGDVGKTFTSNFTRERYEQVVDSCKEYIRAGDIFQVVPSQRLCMETQADPFDIYRALRVVNPSPFMFYLRSPACLLVGSSPEILCRVENGVITNRPLAGTRRRGKTDEEDRALEKELLADPKERAEHVMLVDLGRNDVGRVAKPRTVKLTECMKVERYSHVMHISSNVEGRLAPGKTAFDALRVTLPVGTVTGAPKVRAMQIIDEFEPTRRGPYAGAVGYFDFSGNMDTCIALRTMVILPGSPGQSKVYCQAGGGVVADSVPASEYEETVNKARALLKAVELAERGFE